MREELFLEVLGDPLLDDDVVGVALLFFVKVTNVSEVSSFFSWMRPCMVCMHLSGLRRCGAVKLLTSSHSHGRW